MLGETHYYDGKLDYIKTEIRENLDKAALISSEEKQTIFQCFKAYLEDKCTPKEIKILTRLIDEKDNYHDTTNHLRVDDLLYLCYENIVLLQNYEFLDNFKHQLQDMPTGFCVQGRTIRLLQLLVAFK